MKKLRNDTGLIVGVSLGSVLLASYLSAGPLNPNRIFAAIDGRDYETYKVQTKERIINSYFESYDINRDGLLSKEEFSVFVDKKYMKRF